MTTVDVANAQEPAFSVLIPTWNGLGLLRRNLPSVVEAQSCLKKQTGLSSELVIVDDASEDETAQRLPIEFPSARLVCRERNGGFSKACNTGFKACRAPLVALLNNDVRVEPDYLVHQQPHFFNPNVFAVTAKVFEGQPPIFSAGGRFGKFRRGFWSVYFNYDVDGIGRERKPPQQDLLSAYAVGGFATYDRRKLEQLGGFNDLLSPFHWEDIDLSYRGWKRGWDVHYEPHSRAHHQISATIDSHYRRRHVEEVSLRNRLLFHWINLHSPSFLLRHLGMLGVLLLTRILVLDISFYRGLLGALRRLPAAARLRAAEKRDSRRTDAQVQTLLRAFYETAPIRVFRSRQEILQDHPESREGRGS